MRLEFSDEAAVEVEDDRVHAGGVAEISRWQALKTRRHRIRLRKFSDPGRGRGSMHLRLTRSGTPSGGASCQHCFRGYRAHALNPRLISATPSGVRSSAEILRKGRMTGEISA